MKLIIAGLLLTLSIFLDSIELSYSQSGGSFGHGGRRTGSGRKPRMSLPANYYYATTDPDSEIRSVLHPNAHEIRTEDGHLLGMAENDGRTFHPITLPNGLIVTINLKERRINYLTPEETAELTRAITNDEGGSSSRRRSHSPGGGR